MYAHLSHMPTPLPGLSDHGNSLYIVMRDCRSSETGREYEMCLGATVLFAHILSSFYGTHDIQHRYSVIAPRR